MLLAQVYSFCFGIGEDDTNLGAFDSALLDAGIGNYNLVKVSSILPPSCRYQPHPELSPGQILYSAYVNEFADERHKGQVMSTAIAIAFPKDEMFPAVIMEYSEKCPCRQSESIVTNMCHKAMKRRKIKEYRIELKSNECLAGNKHTCIFGGVILNDI